MLNNIFSIFFVWSFVDAVLCLEKKENKRFVGFVMWGLCFIGFVGYLQSKNW